MFKPTITLAFKVLTPSVAVSRKLARKVPLRCAARAVNMDILFSTRCIGAAAESNPIIPRHRYGAPSNETERSKYGQTDERECARFRDNKQRILRHDYI